MEMHQIRQHRAEPEGFRVMESKSSKQASKTPVRCVLFPSLFLLLFLVSLGIIRSYINPAPLRPFVPPLPLGT